MKLEKSTKDSTLSIVLHTELSTFLLSNYYTLVFNNLLRMKRQLASTVLWLCHEKARACAHIQQEMRNNKYAAVHVRCVGNYIRLSNRE